VSARGQEPNGGGTRTDPLSPDPRLRGRTYAIPFDRVWTEAVALVGGGLPRWRILSADDERGVIDGETRTLVFGSVNRLRVAVGLDEDGQTRVDVRLAPRSGLARLGKARTIGRFLVHLDAQLGARPEQVLDASRTPPWRA
jgi:hypothetical protein